jgi:hypothetical protein
MRNHQLRLVHSAGEVTFTLRPCTRSAMEEALKKARRAAPPPEPPPRVYPPAITCFQCGTRFHGEDVKPIVENDGACDACAEFLDAYTRRSDQGNPDNSDYEWQEPKNAQRI